MPNTAQTTCPLDCPDACALEVEVERGGELGVEERKDAARRCEILEMELQKHLLPKDPNDERNVVLEIRAGTGGEDRASAAVVHAEGGPGRRAGYPAAPASGAPPPRPGAPAPA